MNYPFWDLTAGYGILMAEIAVLHVFISHFAIGGGLYMVVNEYVARRNQDLAHLEFLRKLSKFFVLVTLVLGALTGVGIWFVIGLLNPTATEALIHNFVWGWAIEWTFFVIEIASAILYFYGWKRMSAGNHLIIGWIYFAAAWLSLFVINGILSFMLTPGNWLATGDFWDGFFNPTFWPSLVLRTGICIMLAGLYALIVASRQQKGDFKARIVRYSSAWGITGLLIILVSNYWYWKAIPSAIISIALQKMPKPMGALHYSLWLAGGIGAVLMLLGFLLARRFHISFAVVLMALGLGWFGTFEYFRESIRKPYIISGYMYGNGLEVSQSMNYRTGGLLPRIVYRTGNDGADLFRHVCRSCHTIDGYQSLNPQFRGTDRAFIAAIIKTTNSLKGNMPPFLGTPAEADFIAGYIETHVDRRSLGEIYSLQGAELGGKVYEVRCAKCHIPGTSSDKTKSLAGMGEEDLDNMLNMAADLGEGMPAFTAGPADRMALIAFLKTLSKGENQ